LKELARDGAKTALKQLRAEIIAIERTFPELKLPATRRTVARSIKRVSQRERQFRHPGVSCAARLYRINDVRGLLFGAFDTAYLPATGEEEYSVGTRHKRDVHLT